MTRLAAVLVFALFCGCAPRTPEPYIEPRRDTPFATIVHDQPVVVAEGIGLEVVERWRGALIEGLRLLRRGDVAGREIIVAVLREMYVATGTAAPALSGATLPSAAKDSTPATEDPANVRGVLKRKDEAFAEMNREDKK